MGNLRRYERKKTKSRENFVGGINKIGFRQKQLFYDLRISICCNTLAFCRVSNRLGIIYHRVNNWVYSGS
jgi:hypothetical protein